MVEIFRGEERQDIQLFTGRKLERTPINANLGAPRSQRQTTGFQVAAGRWSSAGGDGARCCLGYDGRPAEYRLAGRGRLLLAGLYLGKPHSRSQVGSVPRRVFFSVGSSGGELGRGDEGEMRGHE